MSEETAATFPATPGAPPVAPAVLGRYRLIRRLGAGAMGEVWEADDPELSRRVAVKLLRFGHATHRERMQREARAMARLAHRNVIAIHDVGESDGRLFLAMELLEGGTLRQWLAEPRSWRAIVEIFVQAGRGLAAAHDAGLVHRDFKPDNVLLGADRRVVVADLGLARLAAAEPPEDEPATRALASDARVTETGTVMGTPAYMAPEQHLGRDVSAAADQFAFAVALWEAVYRQRPFAAGEGDGSLTGALALAVVHGRLRPPPSDVRVPRWLGRALRRGLQVEADRRFPSMAAMVAALERGLARRRRIAITVAVALAVSAVGGGLWAARRDTAAPACDVSNALDGVWDGARRDAVRAGLVATGRPYAGDVAERVVATLDDYARRWSAMRLDACRATRVEGAQSAELLDLRDACLDRRRAGLAALADSLIAADGVALDHAIDAAHGLGELASCADAAGLRALVPPPEAPDTRASVDAAEAQLDHARSLHQLGRETDARAAIVALEPDVRAIGYPRLTAELLDLRGEVEWRVGEMTAARATFEEAGPLAADAHDDTLAATIGVDLLGVVLGALGDDAATQKQRPMIDALVRRAGDPPGPRMDLLYIDAALDMDAGDLDAAEAKYRALLALAEPTGDPHAIRTLGTLAIVALMRNDLDGAAALRERERALAVATYGPDHPKLADLVLHNGVALDGASHAAEAVPLIQQAIELRTRALGADDPGLGEYLLSLAKAQQDTGDRATALAGFRALADRSAHLGDDAMRARALLGAGTLEHQLNDLAGAEADESAALELRARTVGADSIDYAMDEYNLANVELEANACSRAGPRLDHALAVLGKEEASGVYRAYPLSARARCAVATGDAAAARSNVEAARAACAQGAAELQLLGTTADDKRGCPAELRQEIDAAAAWVKAHPR